MAKGSKKEWIGFYTKMLRIRRVEEKLMEVFAKGEIPGFIHACIGQEAAPVAVCSHLRDSDYMSTTHRGHGHALAKGIDLKLFMAELFGRSNGVCKGRSGSMHVADRQLGILGANGIVGGGIPLATGAAFASRFKGGDQVTVCFFGEGAADEGTFHESLNIASVYKLPIVYVCENNGWSQFAESSLLQAVKKVVERLPAYNIPGACVPNDFLRVHEEAGKAIERARSGGGPSLLEVMSSRWYGHYVGDQQKYRPAEEVEAAMKMDCIKDFERVLLTGEGVKKENLAKIDADIRAEIEEAINFARQSPLPAPSDLLTDLYV